MSHLLKNTISLIAFSLLLACGNQAPDSDQPENTQTDSSTATETDTSPETQPTERGGIAVLPTPEDGIFEQAHQLEANLDFEGDFQQGIRWNSGSDLNYLIIATRNSGTFFEEGWKSELLMYHYQAEAENPILNNKYSDQSPNIYSAVVFLKDKSSIVNLGNDQKAPIFAYAICPDGEDPCEIHVSALYRGTLHKLRRMGNESQEDFMTKQKSSLESISRPLQDPMLKLLFSINLDE